MRSFLWLRAGMVISAVGQAAAAWGQVAPADENVPPPQSQPSPDEPASQDESASEPGPAQEPSPETVPAEEPEQEILVVAVPSERSSIDRTTYAIRDTAEARASNTLDLLAQVPSVEVTPAGQLRLLGRSGVRILVDGNEIANPTEFLRNLQGSQVARIEVITNPSAQFSAQGTAGIINIITRRSFSPALGGSLTARLGSFGAHDVTVSPTWTRGGLSLAGSLGHSRNVSPSEFGRDRRTLAPAPGEPAETVERGTRRSRSETLTANLRATYRLAPRQTVTFSAFGFETDGRDSARSDFLFPDEPGLAFSQTLEGRSEAAFRDFSADYRRETERQGEMLTVSAKRSTTRLEADYLALADVGLPEPRPFRFQSNFSIGITSLKLDYVRPFAGVRRLSLGALIQRTSNILFSAESGQPPLGEDSFSSSSTVRGSWLEKAAYVTYQFPLLGGTVLPGLRVEQRRFRIADEAGVRRPGGTHLFPSLHLERRLADWLVGTLSYSRRISWPEIGAFSSDLRFTDPTTAAGGNPLIRPEITDSYESKLQAQVLGQSADLTLFFRRTGDLLSVQSELEDGVLVTRVVNLGARTLLGANLVLRGPLGGGFQYSVTGNLAEQSIEPGELDFDLGADEAQYSASAQLDYRDGAEGRRGADHVMLRLNYTGPIGLGSFRFASTFTGTASWSHAFTDRLSGVLTIADIFGAVTSRTTYLSEFTRSDQFGRGRGPRVTFALTYSLGPPAPR